MGTKVRDYEFDGNDIDYYEQNNQAPTEETKAKLNKKADKQINNGKIKLSSILNITENDAERAYLFDYLNKKGIEIRGQNVTLMGELENYKYLPKMEEIPLPKPLKPEEQKRLFVELDKLKKQGLDDTSPEYREIKNTIAEHNIRLALWVASEVRTYDYNIEQEDLAQMTVMSMLKAIDQYDVNFGVTFASYAVEIMKHSASRSWRTLDKNNQLYQQERFRKFKRAKRDYEQEFGREVSLLEFLEMENIEIGGKKINIARDLLDLGDKSRETFKKYVKYHLRESLDGLNENERLEFEEKLKNTNTSENIGRIEYLDGIPVADGVYLDDESDLDIEDEKRTDDAAMNTVIRTEMEDLVEKMMETANPNEREKIFLEKRFGGIDNKRISEIRRRNGYKAINY